MQATCDDVGMLLAEFDYKNQITIDKINYLFYYARKKYRPRLRREDSPSRREVMSKIAPKLPPTTLMLTGFYVRAALADNAVCGGFDGTFQTAVELTADELDPNGFVTDNHGFIQAVKDKFSEGMFKASCEELTRGIVSIAHDIVGTRLMKVNVMVTNLTGYAETTWHRGQLVPPFPRLATREEKATTLRERKRNAC